MHWPMSLANRLPITAFLSSWTIKDSKDYFNEFARWGSIQNHSATHASFGKKSTDLDHEICYVQKRFGKKYDWYPWMLRPPYGAAQDSRAVRRMGEKCGIEQIVMWDASVGYGKISYANSKLRPGSIVLMHFSPKLKRDLKIAVKKIRDAGLTPANLADYPSPGTHRPRNAHGARCTKTRLLASPLIPGRLPPIRCDRFCRKFCAIL